jgi:hypothetical protein
MKDVEFLDPKSNYKFSTWTLFYGFNQHRSLHDLKQSNSETWTTTESRERRFKGAEMSFLRSAVGMSYREESIRSEDIRSDTNGANM